MRTKANGTLTPEREACCVRREAQPGEAVRSPQHAGFTLVELMIAIGLLSLVIMAIYSSWTAILRASKVGLDAAATAQRSRIAIRMLEDSLASSQAFAAHMQQHPEYYSFVGDENSLSFVARLAKSFPRSGKFGDFDVRRLTFSVEDSTDGGKQLVLRQNTLLIDMDQDEKDHPLVLAKNVDKFQLSFWDKKKNQTGEWVDSWTDNFTNQLPPLVRVVLTLKDHANSFKASEEIVRVVSIPSVTVAPTWQMPNAPGMPPPGAPGMPPGAPGMPPGAPGMQPGAAGMPGGYPGQPTPAGGFIRR